MYRLPAGTGSSYWPGVHGLIELTRTVKVVGCSLSSVPWMVTVCPTARPNVETGFGATGRAGAFAFGWAGALVAAGRLVPVCGLARAVPAAPAPATRARAAIEPVTRTQVRCHSGLRVSVVVMVGGTPSVRSGTVRDRAPARIPSARAGTRPQQAPAVA